MYVHLHNYTADPSDGEWNNPNMRSITSLPPRALPIYILRTAYLAEYPVHEVHDGDVLVDLPLDLRAVLHLERQEVEDEGEDVLVH